MREEVNPCGEADRLSKQRDEQTLKAKKALKVAKLQNSYMICITMNTELSVTTFVTSRWSLWVCQHSGSFCKLCLLASIE